MTRVCSVMHRDLKPSNILIDSKTRHIKIADFGLARSNSHREREWTHEIQTLWYRAPEVLLGATRYGPSVDVWSLGCILAELARGGATLFRGNNSEIDQLYKIFGLLGTPTEELWRGVDQLKDFSYSFPQFSAVDTREWCGGLCDDGVDLLRKMLCYSPSARITPHAALAHPYFADMST